MTNQLTNPVTNLITFDEICELVGLTRSAVYLRSRKIALPDHIKKVGRSKYWAIDDIEDWADQFAEVEQIICRAVHVTIDAVEIPKHSDISSRLLERHWCEIDDAIRFMRAACG